MIVKMRTSAFEGGWLYLDGVRKAQTYGPLRVGDGHQLFSTRQELAERVDEAWGPPQVREFSDELWPELKGDDMSAVVMARLDMDDGQMVLALLVADAFLLGDDGQTVDRLR